MKPKDNWRPSPPEDDDTEAARILEQDWGAEDDCDTGLVSDEAFEWIPF
jgi:hypothetical protein